jgi:hypothetical protein
LQIIACVTATNRGSVYKESKKRGCIIHPRR